MTGTFCLASLSSNSAARIGPILPHLSSRPPWPQIKTTISWTDRAPGNSLRASGSCRIVFFSFLVKNSCCGFRVGGRTKPLTKVSTELSSVGMLGTYWKLGKRKADAGALLGTSWGTMSGSEPGLVAGTVFAFCAGCVDGSASLKGVGGMDELMTDTLWYGYE